MMKFVRKNNETPIGVGRRRVRVRTYRVFLVRVMEIQFFRSDADSYFSILILHTHTHSETFINITTECC